MEGQIEDMAGEQYREAEHAALSLESMREQMASSQVNAILLQMGLEGLSCSNH